VVVVSIFIAIQCNNKILRYGFLKEFVEKNVVFFCNIFQISNFFASDHVSGWSGVDLNRNPLTQWEQRIKRSYYFFKLSQRLIRALLNKITVLFIDTCQTCEKQITCVYTVKFDTCVQAEHTK